MSRAARYAALLAALALAAIASWQIIATRVADGLADSAPQRALAWDPHNPEALLALAQQQLQAGHPQQAAASARELLRTSPLQADGFAVLARAAEASGDAAAARRLFALALPRDPRNQYVRSWMIGTQLQDGDYPAALHNIDVLLDSVPQHEPALLPLLTSVAGQDPAFARALGRHLAGPPAAWYAPMLDELLAHASPAALDAVFDAMQTDGRGLTEAVAGRWFARLEQKGRWGEAYSRWTSRVGIPADGILPAIYNGNFAHPVTGIGFDWVMRGEPGVVVERVRTGGATDGYAAAVTFRGRRADDIGFEQTLLLAPGHYRLAFRARAEDLRSDKGLAWSITCAGGQHIANSPLLGGNFDWKTVSTGFTVPATQCPAQKLALVNPGAGGTGKVVSGQLWFDDFRITPAPAPPPATP